MSYKRYRLRLFPTKDQEKMLWKHIHACRWMWNELLAINLKYHSEHNKYLMHYDMNNIATSIRNDPRNYWLHDVSRHSLGLVCGDLATCISKYLHKYTNMPSFKSKKRAKNSFPVRNDKSGIVVRSSKCIKIPKVGNMKYRLDYRKENIDILNIHFGDPRIVYTKNSKWILSFVLNHENQMINTLNGPLGIDMGIEKLATYSYANKNGNIVSEKIHNINKSTYMKNIDAKIKYHQRNLSRKIAVAKSFGYDWNTSNRYQKERNKYLSLLYHKYNIYQDLYNKITSHLVYDIRPQLIWMEDLSIGNMVKHKSFANKIYAAHWGMFIQMMIRKSDYVEIPLLFVPRNYPSSKLCSNCGAKQQISISQRMYTCPKCGLHIDRDVNASINLMRYSDYRIEDTGIVYLDRHFRPKTYSRKYKKS